MITRGQFVFGLSPTFVLCGHHLLFAFLLVAFCLFACFLASLLTMLIMLICFMPSHLLSAFFPSIACLLVSCLCLCVYTHGVRTLGARAKSPRHKQKGHVCKHVVEPNDNLPICIRYIMIVPFFLIFRVWLGLVIKSTRNR